MCTDIKIWIEEIISQEAFYQRKSYSDSSVLFFCSFIYCIYRHSEWNFIIYGGLEFNGRILLLGCQFDEKWFSYYWICQVQSLFPIFYENINFVWIFNGISLDKSINSSNKEM